ncbi:hypothetical protein [Streptomyces spectabilis]|uniref:Ribosomal protein S27E n=2 Tax=Streptomyces spectabilis TaxID=68270 RepID=A0A7W8AV11_STRST|nr:hypothetical protein [Streptomyces spectabilis]MBB5105204.1 ribosomal protein S27E [Streptomyces spectabilis]GGV05829.1 hypothetical protein GCM10010245_12070 [Streptomyces spectabilis]
MTGTGDQREAVREMTTDGVPVRCPVCRHEQAYAPPAFPCSCGAPVVPPVAYDAAATPVTERSWADDWVTVRCGACGREADWPRPEVGCTCGTVLRIPVRTEAASPPGPGPAPPRPAFRPVPVRSARDAVTTAARYLRWLGYADVRDAVAGPEGRAPSGARLTARGVLAHVEPSARPASLRDLECAWLTALTHEVTCVCFALSDFTPEACERAAELGVPLFRIELDGVPAALNGAAEALAARGT